MPTGEFCDFSAHGLVIVKAMRSGVRQVTTSIEPARRNYRSTPCGRAVVRVRFTPSARIQFLSALAHIRRDSPAAAVLFHNRVERILLEEFPESGRVVSGFPETCRVPGGSNFTVPFPLPGQRGDSLDCRGMARCTGPRITNVQIARQAVADCRQSTLFGISKLTTKRWISQPHGVISSLNYLQDADLHGSSCP